MLVVVLLKIYILLSIIIVRAWSGALIVSACLSVCLSVHLSEDSFVQLTLNALIPVHHNHTVVRSYSQDVHCGGLKGVTCDYQSIWSINQYIRVKQCCSLVMRRDTVVVDSAATWQPCPGWCNVHPGLKGYGLIMTRIDGLIMSVDGLTIRVHNSC